MTKKDRQMLEADLASHISRRKELKQDVNTMFLKRENYSVKSLIASYDKIIKEIKLELKTS